MNKWLDILLVAFWLLYVNCALFVQKSRFPQYVRVAISTDLDSVTITGFVKDRYCENFSIKSTDSLPTYVKPKANVVVVNKKSYYGYLEVRRHYGKIWVINTLSIEDYLKGVVPCEIGRLKPDLIEAAKAQAVAARTYTYAHLGKNEKLGFDLYATTKDQVYGGIEVEDSVINRAIARTRGQIIMYNYKPIDAKYHSTCGGRTADYNDAWGGNPVSYLRSVECEFCRESPHFAWQKIQGKQEFFDNLRANLNRAGFVISDSELIKAFRFKRNGKSKRIIEIKILTSESEHTIPAGKIRLVLGSPGDPGGLLKSNWFSMIPQGDRIIIEGKGFGHGTGMCQFGAIGMARKGKKYREILKHYYPGTELVKF